MAIFLDVIYSEIREEWEAREMCACCLLCHEAHLCIYTYTSPNKASSAGLG